MIFIFLYMELTGNYHDVGASIEGLMFLMCTTAGILKHICITVNRKKLAKNINAAINDWLLVRSDERSYKIMKKYAFRSKMFTVIIVYTTYFCSAIYALAVILMNYKRIFLFDTNMSNGMHLLNR